jgi:hypothetical protein
MRLRTPSSSVCSDTIAASKRSRLCLCHERRQVFTALNIGLARLWLTGHLSRDLLLLRVEMSALAWWSEFSPWWFLKDVIAVGHDIVLRKCL